MKHGRGMKARNDKSIGVEILSDRYFRQNQTNRPLEDYLNMKREGIEIDPIPHTSFAREDLLFIMNREDTFVY